MEHAGKAKDMISVHVANEYAHFPVNSSFSLYELSLGSLATIEEE